MQKSYLLLVLFFLIGLSTYNSSCLVVENQYTGLAPGTWRAVLGIEPKFISPNKKGQPLPEKMDMKFEEVADGELPFTFEVVYENENDFYINVINGSEKIRVDDIKIGRNRATARDTIWIDFPIYESYIKGEFEEGLIDGEWVVKTRKNYSIPFTAKHGKDHRFTTLRKEPITDMSGKWEVHFQDGDDTYPAIGEFVQKGNHLEGTFLTETGDYRFLEGTIQENKFYLSCFDGSHAFLFEGKLNDADNVVGSFRSGKHYKTTWTGKRNANFEIADPNSLTYLKEGYADDSVNFEFENEQGKLIGLTDTRYEGKAKIVQILGTWCPNCRDETEFLVDYLEKNKPKDLEVIALAFEKHRDPNKAKNAIKTYKEKFGMNYEMLLAGYSNKKEAAQSLPMLNHIKSYPTMIFLDKKNQVKKIHTGFAGPATSEYGKFVKEFDEFIKEIIVE